MIDRETIYSTIFKAFSAVPGFTTCSRRLDNFVNVPAMMQPALFQLQAGERYTPHRGTPPKITMQLELFLYAQGNDPTVAPSTVLNPLIDAVLAVLAPDTAGDDLSNYVCTLGIANVQHIWVEGEIKIAEGVLENQVIAVIPVNILAV